MTFWAENKVTQKECLNYYADNIESSDLKGINDLAQYYQGKSLNELSDKEILELILVMEQPTYYNKKKHPERVEKAVENALKRIKL